MSNQAGRRACTEARGCDSAADVDGRGWWVMADDVVVGAVSAGGYVCVCVRGQWRGLAGGRRVSGTRGESTRRDGGMTAAGDKASNSSAGTETERVG